MSEGCETWNESAENESVTESERAISTGSASAIAGFGSESEYGSESAHVATMIVTASASESESVVTVSGGGDRLVPSCSVDPCCYCCCCCCCCSCLWHHLALETRCLRHDRHHCDGRPRDRGWHPGPGPGQGAAVTACGRASAATFVSARLAASVSAASRPAWVPRHQTQGMRLQQPDRRLRGPVLLCSACPW